MNILEESDRKLSFDVTRCAYAEMYERLGLKEFGPCLSCRRDGSFAEGFNPSLKLKRTQTIMEGAPFCDFRFTHRMKLVPGDNPTARDRNEPPALPC